MDKIVIRGGKPLSGTVEASGSKNAALPLMCAALLTEDEMAFHRVPALPGASDRDRSACRPFAHSPDHQGAAPPSLSSRDNH